MTSPVTVYDPQGNAHQMSPQNAFDMVAYGWSMSGSGNKGAAAPKANSPDFGGAAEVAMIGPDGKVETHTVANAKDLLATGAWRQATDEEIAAAAKPADDGKDAGQQTQLQNGKDAGAGGDDGKGQQTTSNDGKAPESEGKKDEGKDAQTPKNPADEIPEGSDRAALTAFAQKFKLSYVVGKSNAENRESLIAQYAAKNKAS